MILKNVLVVDDEPDIRELLEITLSRMNLDSHAAANVREAKSLLDNKPFDLCLTDMKLPDGTGIELVEHIQDQFPHIPVAVITAFGSMEAAIKALKAGAFDFVSKPIDLNILRGLVDSALKVASTPIDKTTNSEAKASQKLLGESEAMLALRQKIDKLARSQAPVYLRGESGVGKELVATQIHQQGPRANSSFVPVNCGAIPTELMESEFFGHLKGSFTGAMSDKEGLFQAANGGTLFLDEIAELPIHMQVKLLRAIQEKAIKPIGGQKEIPVDIRLLSATHKDLAAEVETGNFRQDLYYRINVIELNIPPLRERITDLPILANFMLSRISGSNSDTYSLSDDAIEKLKTYPFPGNIRELENILERAATLCDGNEITANDLDLPDSKPAAGVADEINPDESSISLSVDQLEDYLIQKERKAIVAALEQTRWNKTAAAKLLGITFRQLRYRLQKLELE
ncbi:MAG: sigma-54 dependent transcriptional regulator [Gammaproteobacteria bacterium]|nr:sigma-54 dependent transcriptional regulator [Gammaproteobacteria bacterium]